MARFGLSIVLSLQVVRDWLLFILEVNGEDAFFYLELVPNIYILVPCLVELDDRWCGKTITSNEINLSGEEVLSI